MNDLQKLLHKKWYLQGFNATPALLYGPAFSMVRDMPEFLGFGYSACFEYFKNDVCYYAYAWDDLYDILNKLLEKTASNPKYTEYLVNQNEKICREAGRAYAKIGKVDRKTANLKKLFSLWREANDLYAHLVSVSHIVEGFTLTAEDKIRALIRAEFSSDFLTKTIILTAPSVHSFITSEHYELCLIARDIKKRRHKNIYF